MVSIIFVIVPYLLNKRPHTSSLKIRDMLTIRITLINKQGVKMKKLKITSIIIVFLAGISFPKSGTYSGGDGNASGDSEANAIYISTTNDLIELSKTSTDWTLYFKQTADISFNEDESLVDWNGDGSPDGVNPAGFITIGNGFTQFTGTYDGCGYTISNIYINRPTGDNLGGLLGYTDHSILKNVGVVNGSITARQNIAGLVGRSRNSTIINCYSNMEVHGVTNVGGLIGYNEYRCTVEKCYSLGSVSGEVRVGGLIGYNFFLGSLNNSYSMGNVMRVSGTDTQIGGFVGYSEEGNIYNCYSTGSVTYSDETDPTDKGFVGIANNDNFRNNFWDINTSNQVSANSALGRTSAEMKTLTTFTDYTDGSNGLVTPVWDFETNPNDDAANNNYWDIDLSRAVNNGYPFLSWQNGEAVTLPVELISFKAIVNNNKVTLYWQTVTEENNYGFSIEKLVDDDGLQGADNIKSAPNNWETIGFVPGHGNSNRANSYEFVDNTPGKEKYYTIRYRLNQIDTDGSYEYSKVLEVAINPAPMKFILCQNYPNPFNPVTNIKYEITNTGRVSLNVYNALGEKVAVLVDGIQPAGSYSVRFDASKLTSGAYIYKLSAGEFVATKKLTFIK